MPGETEVKPPPHAFTPIDQKAALCPEDFRVLESFVEQRTTEFKISLRLETNCSSHAVTDKLTVANGQRLTADAMIEKQQMQQRRVRRKLMLECLNVELPLRTPFCLTKFRQSGTMKMERSTALETAKKKRTPMCQSVEPRDFHASFWVMVFLREIIGHFRRVFQREPQGG